MLDCSSPAAASDRSASPTAWPTVAPPRLPRALVLSRQLTVPRECAEKTISRGAAENASEIAEKGCFRPSGSAGLAEGHQQPLSYLSSPRSQRSLRETRCDKWGCS